MHVSIAVTLIIIIKLFIVVAHAARSLTIQEAQVSETGSGHEFRQLPRLYPGEGTEREKFNTQGELWSSVTTEHASDI